MTEEARRDWLAVAWGTLKHLPADLLSAGCGAARQRADHPSKIVPTIIEETREVLERRKDRYRDLVSARKALPEPGFEPCKPEQAAAIMEEFGLRRNPLDQCITSPAQGRGE